MKTITKDTIKDYGSFCDRKDSFDDNQESIIFIKFLKNQYGDKFNIIDKPFGKYGVDIGVFNKNSEITEDSIKVAFDLERCKSWGNDWPAHWKCLSFLGRKNKYLMFPEFGMVWFNCDLNKFAISWKENIQKYPLTNRNFKGKSYTDSVREVKFDDGKLFGSSFEKIEKENFKNRMEFNLK